METKVNYVIVGLFVLLLSFALIAGVLWLSSGKQYSKTYDNYTAYMRESVSGLNLNAPVKYRGVEVGQVKQISLDDGNPEQVHLEFAIERGIPIKEDTVAILKVQGLTGIAYVELSGGSRNSPLLKAVGEEKFPVIKTGPSLLGRLDVALTALLTNLNKTTENLNALLSEDNRHSIKQALADLAVLSNTIAANRKEIDAGIKGAARTMENTAQVSAELPELLDHIARSADAVGKMAGDASRASVSVRNTSESVGQKTQRFADDSLPELESLMREMRDVSVSLRRVTEQVEQNPAMLIRGKQAPKPGPGE